MKITIITVCYNCADAIDKTVQSILDQTYPNIEYIVVDGNSTDGTTEALKRYASHFDHLISEEDEGIYNAMNKGLNLASGDYVFFLNCGDRLYSTNTIEEVASHAQGQDIIYGDMFLEFTDGRKSRRMKYPGKLNRFLFLHRGLGHQATFIKRAIYQKLNGFDEQYEILADLDLLLRFLFKPKVSQGYIPQVISFYDMHGLSSSPETFWLRQQERIRILKKHYPILLYCIAKLRYHLFAKRRKRLHRRALKYIDRTLNYLGGVAD